MRIERGALAMGAAIPNRGHGFLRAMLHCET
jgi:hypothetical protein